MKIGKLVNQSIPAIIEYCNKTDQNELNNLLDLNYSNKILGLHYPFFIELSKISNNDSKREPRRFYKNIYNVCDKKVKLTSQWFDYHTEKFKKYMEKINSEFNGKEIPLSSANTGSLFEESNEQENTEIQNFTYERDLQNSLISQAESLFPGFKIYGNYEGIEYTLEGRRIDLLLENKEANTLLAIELKAGEADFKVFGQISMYLGLLAMKFPDKKIKGCVIAGDIDNTLKYASSTNSNIKLFEYQMKISLDEIKL
ncbi:MAG: PDDEXK nuclease domain-containing protein [Oscillospiraceae bacterium]|nr:PDDEXK nuclease domain-containing protein [Oscillospiraceae bacterium]